MRSFPFILLRIICRSLLPSTTKVLGDCVFILHKMSFSRVDAQLLNYQKYALLNKRKLCRSVFFYFLLGNSSSKFWYLSLPIYDIVAIIAIKILHLSQKCDFPITLLRLYLNCLQLLQIIVCT